MYLLTIFLFLSTFLVGTVITDSSKKAVYLGRIPSKLNKRSHARLIPSNPEEYDGVNASKLWIPLKQVPNNEIKQLPSLNDLTPFHEVLYRRALHKDYDYAQFGQSCKLFTVDEIEAFLKIVENFIKLHDGKSLGPVISPQEQGEQLEQLFNHSVGICDFRNLLTCHKYDFTCACAHPSMGVNRDGLCGINIGHPCELSGRTLQKHGILVMPEMSPVKCLLENADCAMESDKETLGEGVSPIRKICKCRRGFRGATCNKRHGPAGIKQMKEKQKNKVRSGEESEVGSLSVEVEVGRPIWMDDNGVTSREYFMHPEEIRDKLVDLMNQKEMYPPESRQEEAWNLVRIMEDDADMEEMVVYDLLMREIASLKHGDSCDPGRQVVLDNPPVAKNDHRWIDPHPEDIKSWQMSILHPKQPICNIYKLLRCDEATKVCECKPGLQLHSISGRINATSCRIPLGYDCDLDFEPVLEFDPLRNRKRFSEMDPPECVSGTECTEKPLFFQKKCWCANGYCVKSKFDEEMYSSMVIAIQSRFSLQLGDSCDPKLHKRLLSYQSNEGSGFQKRLAFLREVVESPESRFCDIDSYLNCSEISRTCECWKQLQPVERKDGDFDCVAMNMASCGRTFNYGKYMFNREGAQLWQVEKTFEKRFVPGCVPHATCTGVNKPQWAGRCTCNNSSRSGETCDEKRSILAAAFTPNRIPQDDSEEIAVLRVFSDLNAYTMLMEQLMTAGINDACDPSVGLTLDRIVKFWREIADSNDTNSERRTLPYYIAATKWTKYLVSTAEGNSASLCNATVGLRCHRNTRKCNCRLGSRWVGNKCYLEGNETCDPKPSAEWVAECMRGTMCSRLQKSDDYRCLPCRRKKMDGTCILGEMAQEEHFGDAWYVQDDEPKQSLKPSTSFVAVKKGKKVEVIMKEGNNAAPKVIKKDNVKEKIKKEKENDVIKKEKVHEVDDADTEIERPVEVPSNQQSLPKRSVHAEIEREDYNNDDESEPEYGSGPGIEYASQASTRNEVEVRDEDGIKTFAIKAKQSNGAKNGGAPIKIISGTEKVKRRQVGDNEHVKGHKNAGYDMSKHQRDQYIQEIIRMLREILLFRHFSIREPCNLQDEEKLASAFPTLPVYDLSHLPGNYTIPTTYIVLSRMYWKGISFCNRNKFLTCTREEICGCSFGFGLIEENGECRLREHIYCNRDSIYFGKRSTDFVPDAKAIIIRHPTYQCQTGTKCTQIDFGLPVCVKIDDLDDDGRKEGKLEAKQLYFPNEDFQGYDKETLPEEPNGSGSHACCCRQACSLGIMVLQLLFTWALM